MVLYCRLRAVREGLGLTLRDVGAATGVHHGVLSRWERGGDATVSLALKVARFFGKSVEELWAPIEAAPAKDKSEATK